MVGVAAFRWFWEIGCWCLVRINKTLGRCIGGRRAYISTMSSTWLHMATNRSKNLNLYSWAEAYLLTYRPEPTICFHLFPSPSALFRSSWKFCGFWLLRLGSGHGGESPCPGCFHMQSEPIVRSRQPGFPTEGLVSEEQVVSARPSRTSRRCNKWRCLWARPHPPQHDEL